MSKPNNEMIEAILKRKGYTPLDVGLYVYHKYPVFTEVILNCSVIAKIYWDRGEIHIGNGRDRDELTKARVNAILWHFCGMKVKVKSKDWFYGDKNLPWADGYNRFRFGEIMCNIYSHFWENEL